MNIKHQAVIAAIALSAAGFASAASTKDIVVERIAAPTPMVSSGGVVSDAMAVSVLLESPDGSLTPHSTENLFRTGDRFRVKLLASRDAKVSLYNTNPRGELSAEPIWQGTVEAGLETITPRMRLDGTSGVDLLHVVLEPKSEAGIFGWLSNWLDRFKGGTSKDIHLDVQNTESATYLLNTQHEGLVTTIRIAHR